MNISSTRVSDTGPTYESINRVDFNRFPATDRRLTLRVAAIACVVSCCLVAVDLWDHREQFDPEGITYLDMADAYRRGDWRAALVGNWSPLYAWLLALMMLFFNPSAQWEFTAVHVLNYFIYLVTLASFSVFMMEFLRAKRESTANERLPDWSWLVLGYSLFTWSVIRLIPPHQPEPDLFVCALLYLIFTMLFRIRRGITTWAESIILGLILGLGYLAKGVMFPMAFVFTVVALILARRSAEKVHKILVAFSVFLLLSLPYIVILSDATGRWTVNDAGWFTYAVHVNQVKHWNHWQGEKAGQGTPVHPTRKIHDDPPMYEFGKPFKVTYPPWYNPTYWYEGIKLTIDLPRHLYIIGRNTKDILFFFASSPGSGDLKFRSWGEFYGNIDMTIGPILALFGALALSTLGRVAVFKEAASHWFLLVPVGAVLGAYALLHYEGRYIAAYVVVLWIVLFRSIAIPPSVESKKIFNAILTSAALVIVITLAIGSGRAVFHAARQFVMGNAEPPFFQSGYTNWKVAKFLNEAGLRAGDPVGAVGWTYSAYWARMARVRIVAEIPDEPGGARTFWSLDPEKNAAVMQLFRDVGAKAVVVSERAPSDLVPANWQQIGNSNYYVYLFQRPSV